MRKLKELREAQKMSQETVANLSEVSQQAISKYEKSDNYPDGYHLKKFAQIFGVSSDYLLDLDEKRPVEVKYMKLPEREEKLLKRFRELNEDNKDIIMGNIASLLKEEREENPEPPMAVNAKK
jgi:transcriptional regulator with XRE-family HTH domain